MESMAYLSLGSNVGDREENLRAAISRLKELGHVEAVSSMYETEPVEVTDQPWFINCAVKLVTTKSPDDVLAGVLGIERSMGRERTRPKGPRNIDIDILLYGERVVAQPGLTIPHPGLPERMFVLAPLAEIAPEVRHPVLGNTILQLRDALPKGNPVVRPIQTAKVETSKPK
jgi:2-amino-4-hydroxy-6-hydroxymethyldihydropteridine diphosphokinase